MHKSGTQQIQITEIVFWITQSNSMVIHSCTPKDSAHQSDKHKGEFIIQHASKHYKN